MGFKLRDFLGDTVLPAAQIIGGAMTGNGMMIAAGAMQLYGKKTGSKTVLRNGQLLGLAAAAHAAYQGMAANATQAAGEGTALAGGTDVGAQAVPAGGLSEAGAATGASSAESGLGLAENSFDSGAMMTATNGSPAAQTVSSIGAGQTPMSSVVGASSNAAEGITGSYANAPAYSPQLAGTNTGLTMAGSSYAPAVSSMQLPTGQVLADGGMLSGLSMPSGSGWLMGGMALQGAAGYQGQREQRQEQEAELQRQRDEREAERQRLNAGMLAINMPFRPSPRSTPGRVA